MKAKVIADFMGVHYSRKGKEIVLLLCGGDKASQQSDIKLAKKYWRKYCE